MPDVIKIPKTRLAAAVLVPAASVAAAVFLCGSRYPVIWALDIALLAAALVPLYLERKNGSFDLFNLKNAFVLYYTLQFGVWTALMLTGKPRFLPSFEGSSRAITLALCFAAAGLASFYLGYYSDLGSLSARLPHISGRMRPARLWLTQAVLVALSFLAFVGLMHRGGGFGYFITHIDEFRTEKLLGSGYLFHGISMLSLSFLLYSAYSYRRGGGAGVYLYAAACAAVSMLAGFRHMTVHTLVYLLVTRHYLYREIRLKLRHAVLAAALVVVNAGYVVFRSYGFLIGERGFMDAVSGMNFGDVTFRYSLGRFHGTESLARIIEDVPRVGFQYGRYYLLDVVSFFIPRALWAEKPVSSGLRHNTLFWYDYFQQGDTGAIIPSLAGELYWMAGIAGIIIGMFAAGVFLKAAYVYMKSSRSSASVAIYAVTFWFAMFVNETVSLHTVTYLSALIPLILCLLFINSFRLEPAGRADYKRAIGRLP